MVNDLDHPLVQTLLKSRPDLRHSLERQLKKTSGKIQGVFASVSGNHCPVCHMIPAMVQLARLQAGEIIQCERCGRFLHRPRQAYGEDAPGLE